MLNEELLINNKEERDKYINRINVLEQVKIIFNKWIKVGFYKNFKIL